MSRSYREPWFVDGYGSKRKKFFKNAANRKIRKSKEVPDYKSYKKFYSQYDICDYKYKWHPDPICFWYNGEFHCEDPDPKWKVSRK